VYIDNVIPDMHGVRKPWLYFLQRTYWTWKSYETVEGVPSLYKIILILIGHDLGSPVMIPFLKTSGKEQVLDQAQLLNSDDLKDEDVKAEEDMVKKEKHDNVTTTGIAVQVQGLVKAFSKVSWDGMCCRSSVLQYAVKVGDILIRF
jgi:hypothetical protein